LPEHCIHDFRRVDLLEASSFLGIAHVSDQPLEYSPALGMPEHRAGGFFLHVEQVQLAPDLAMVALLGFFQPVKSALLDARIPASYREPGGLWFGFSLRARLIAYNKAKVKAAEVPTYEALADPKWKGRVCMRSSTNVYNLSLMGAMIDHLGEAKAEQWAQGVKGNLARAPKGGDTDQLKSVAAGECDVTITNQYYYARLLRSQKADEREVAERVGVVFANQASWGTHVNVSGAGVMKHAPNREAAVKFLASDRHRRQDLPVACTSLRNKPRQALQGSTPLHRPPITVVWWHPCRRR